MLHQHLAEAEDVEIPRGLRRKIQKRLKEDPRIPWDNAIADLAPENSAR